MKFDVILANPPYGRIGNEITQGIVDNIEWEVYVNLMPANDYRRFNKSNKLYQYVDIRSMKPVIDGFADAAVTTHMALINKERSMYLGEDEFEIENYIDPQLKKYFYENLKREHYALNHCPAHMVAADFESGKANIQNTVIFGHRTVSNKHLAYGENDYYHWNVLEDIDTPYVLEHCREKLRGVMLKRMTFTGITFKTHQEKKNFANFVYSNKEFIAKLFVAVNVDAYHDLGKIFPRVDWSKQHTVKDILKDYGYTPKEIDEVMDDLKNFRGLEE